MVLDVVFLILGAALVIWGVIGVINPDLSWRLNERTGIRRSLPNGQPAPDWPRTSRRYGWFGIVAGLFNIVLSVIALA